jgi:hypothetical protein
MYNTELFLEGVLGVPGIWGFRKEDIKKNGHSITISNPRFENLMTALQYISYN